MGEGIHSNISSVVDIQGWWVLNSKIFGQKLTYSKEFFFEKKSVNELWLVKKCQNRTYKVNFRCQKSTEFFQKISSKNIILGDHFLVKLYFRNSIFQQLYFLKLCPIFDELTFPIGIFETFSLGVC